MAAKRAIRSTEPKAGKFSSGTVHTLELAELLSVLRTNSRATFSSVTRQSDDWNGNMAYIDALDAVEFGAWDAPAIERITLPDLNGDSEDMRYFYDVTGNSLDVASFIAGEPEYWLTEEPVRKPCGRVIRLAVEIGGLGDVSAIQLANRGQAIIALINSLELAGHSVELTVVRSFTNAASQDFTFLIPVKHAGQAIDIKRLQFIIGHPSFYRRCLFGLSEIAQGQNLNKCVTWTAQHKPEGFIHIPHSVGLGWSPQASLDWAKGFALSLTTESIAA